MARVTGEGWTWWPQGLSNVTTIVNEDPYSAPKDGTENLLKFERSFLKERPGSPS